MRAINHFIRARSMPVLNSKHTDKFNKYFLHTIERERQRQTDRDRQTDRQIETETERHTERERKSCEKKKEVKK